MAILLVEDDLEICAMLKAYLETENFEVVAAHDGREACKKFEERSWELVLLDLMIPVIGGMDVLQVIRKKSVVPVIIISAKDTEADKTLGLGLGADDYITKPFSVTEVLARIKANIRRATQYGMPAEKDEVLQAGEIVMDLSDYTVTKAGEKIDLTAKEFEILKLLMKNPKKVYTKEQIYSLVWNDAYFGDENAVNVHLSRLRNELEDETLSRSGMRKEISGITRELKKILDEDRDSYLTVFTDKKEMMELVVQINRLLEKHLKTKADFNRSELASKRMLSNISHDIKTPMTVVLGYLEIMRLQGSGNGEMLEKTEQKAQSVMELINQFFTLAKLEAGDTDLELSKLDIGGICRETVLGFYEILTEKDFQVEIIVPEEAVFVQGNKEALQRILFNLISNVIRYGWEGKYLGVALREDEKMVYIDVTDKGKGIDKKFAENVFERLFTMEDSRSRKVQGNGLGLTIAKNLALQMGGDIVLDSIPFERTTFTLLLKKY